MTKVTWLDIVTYTDEEITRPYKKLLSERNTYGLLLEDEDCYVVVHTEQDEEEIDKDFTVIPKSVVTKIVHYGPPREI